MGANTSATLKNARGAGGTAIMAYLALQSTAAASSAGTELSGGSPAYARIPTSWSAWSAGSSSTTQTHNVASGSTVQSGAMYTAVTAGTFLDAFSLTSQTFSSQGTYQTTVTDTQN